MKKRFFRMKLLCLAVMVLAGLQLWQLHSGRQQTQRSYGALKQHLAPAETEAAEQPPERNRKFDDLLAQSEDVVGWLQVEGTNVDYPVMQTPGEPEYYLRRSFDRADDYHGTPFLAGDCDLLTADNLVVYGHNLQDGTMFAQLLRFADPAFCQEHGSITFDTVWEDGTWQVVLVFRIGAEDTAAFAYHKMAELGESPAEYLARCRYYAVWDSGIVPESGTRLLTLSTCEPAMDDGRLVIVAQKIA